MENQPGNLKEDKKVAVESMFDSIAWRYDFLNHFLSFGIDWYWRRRAIRLIARFYKNPYILDVATGTCDLAIASMKIDPMKVDCIDISAKMLDIGREKVHKKGFDEKIKLSEGDSENIPCSNNVYDVVMVAFGVRNFSDPMKGLYEMMRVLRKGGMVLVLEFSKPKGFPFKHVYSFYFRNVLPFLGKIFSKHKSAYTYLPDSVLKFPDNEEFLELLRLSGFSNTRQIKLTGGVASIYTGFKLSGQ